MIRRRTGGSAQFAGPLLFFWVLSLAAPHARAVEWIPPRPVSAWLPGATIAPGNSATLELVLQRSGPATSVEWSVASAGNFFCTVTPSSGSIVLGANSLVRIPLNVAAPPGSLGVGSITATVTYANGGTLAAKGSGTIIAATNSRPEIWSVTPTWSGTAGTSGSVAFRIRSRTAGSETYDLTSGRSNPDPNNVGALFAGAAPPESVVVPGMGTVTINAPTALASRAPAGSLNAVQVTVTSSEGLSTATAFAMIDTSLPDSLPTALVPIGVAPVPEAPAGRDGPVALPWRNAWLVPCGSEGVRVWRASSTDSIGLTDLNGDGADDRLVGTIRIPTFAAALSVVPGFVAPSGDTLDLGLLAAGPSGLMVLDLRVIEDPTFGSWEDFFDTDQNGIDDRILRTVPLSGFATDVAWTRSPSGRLIAFVADADVGSNPVLDSFDPSLVSPGSGAGIVAIDVTAAVDSLSGLPVVAGTWPTPGNALDVELRGGGASATLAVADGAAGLEVADATIGAGTPATATMTPRATTPLSSAWGTPYARDCAWIPNAGDSAYVAVAAGAGGLQIARVPGTAGAAPTLVLAQQTAGAACGLASAYTGILAAAQGTAGVALLQSPGAGALAVITPAASAPYTAPVVLARGAAFPGGTALEKATFQNPAGHATALAFEPTAGMLPDLFVSDQARVLVLRPGSAAVTSVAVGERPAPPARGRVTLDVSPNPSSGVCIVRVHGTTEVAGASGSGAASVGPVLRLRAGSRIDVLDVQGRLVRALRLERDAVRGEDGALRWDGRDRTGRQVPSGRYWLRLRDAGGHASGATPILLLR